MSSFSFPAIDDAVCKIDRNFKHNCKFSSKGFEESIYFKLHYEDAKLYITSRTQRKS